MWIVLVTLAFSAPIDADCAAKLGGVEASTAAAHEVRLAKVAEAQRTPSASELASRISKVAFEWSISEQTSDGVTDVHEARSDTAEGIRSLRDQVRSRLSLDAQIREAERAWIEASRARNQHMCAQSACAQGPNCSGGPHKASIKLVGQLDALYTQLSADEATFSDRYSFQVILGRVRGAGIAERPRGTDEVRAATLLEWLSSSSARPSTARGRVGAFLAEVASLPRLTSGQLAYARYLVGWGADRKRNLALFGKDIDRIVDAWHALDAATGRMEREQRGRMVSMARGRLTAHDRPPPTRGSVFAQ